MKKTLKDELISLIKQNNDSILYLENHMNIFISSEDFDKAMKLKTEINTLKFIQKKLTNILNKSI